MKIIRSVYFALACSFVSANVLFQPVCAASNIPAERDTLRLHTGLPKKTGDSLFSYTVEWLVEDGKSYHATGLSFLNAAKVDSSTSGEVITKKLLKAMKDGMEQLYPDWRGITIEQPQDQAALIIANKAGYAVTTVTVKDYTNQALRFDLMDKPFNSAGVQVAIDLVLAADVEYLDNFSAKKSQTATQGDIMISVDEQRPIHIKTDGKTTQDLEQEIARQLSSSQVSGTALFPGLIGKDKRNNKPFDGSEVQVLNLAAKSIAIEITDPALGVLTKFKFKDGNHSGSAAEPKSMLGIIGGIALLALGFFWYKNAKKTS